MEGEGAQVYMSVCVCAHKTAEVCSILLCHARGVERNGNQDEVRPYFLL